MKKFFAWLMVLALIITMMPAPGEHGQANAAEEGAPCSTCQAQGKECKFGFSPMFFVNRYVCGGCFCDESSHELHECNLEWDAYVPPTCMKKGFNSYECAECGARNYEYIKPDPDAHK